MAGAAAVVAGAVWFGNGWCNSEDGVYRRYVFKPLVLIPSIEDSRLRLALEDPGWLNRCTDDLHGDIAHANGLPETAPAEIDLPEIGGELTPGGSAEPHHLMEDAGAFDGEGHRRQRGGDGGVGGHGFRLA